LVFQPIERIEADPDVPLRDVMNRIGQEMGELAGAVHRIQSLVSLLVREDAFHEGKNVHEMQSLDLIAQKMECLSDFLGALSRDVPAFWRIDTREAAQLMALSELVARLTFTDSAADLAAVSAGDFEAF
jgi:hypothetical protein